jgi:DNA-binding transcriptional LysR family regulator
MTSNRPQTFDLGTLRSLVTIAETGSMTRAAGRLFLTQSAISIQIKRLETSLGFSLFERTSQGMAPTLEGEQLLQFARRMLALNDEAMGRLTSPDYEGVVRFGTPGDIVYPQIPRVLKEFSRDFPRVQIRFSTLGTFNLLREFDEGQHDIVLTTEETPRDDAEIIVTHPLVWIGAEDGNAWKKRPMPLGFSRHCAFRAGVIRALDEAGVAWIDQVHSEHEAAIDAMVSADFCVSSRLSASGPPDTRAIDHGGQLPDLPDYSIAMYSHDDGANPVVRTLADYLRRAHH